MRDTYGETNEMAGQDESKCLARAAKQWKVCGSTPNHPVIAIYGRTGAMTLGGDGCFFADYGCPAHGSSNRGQIYRDTYAEQHLNASTNEEACLSRAYNQWQYCGGSDKYPITSIFRPTEKSPWKGMRQKNECRRNAMILPNLDATMIRHDIAKFGCHHDTS
ncbi:hypothetical protein CHS0354_004616 [Potamilus streckersoni]|uniref:Uncharacterized protein n=1 Tax=Potamilus streckersoni TaxID=2493646 RepID=A0AAE0VPM8_9BIVA|nr:hypothetical protein CHS0354_004616 [Potamilus streckersoni]